MTDDREVHMIKLPNGGLLAVLALGLAPPFAVAQEAEDPESGAGLFYTHCAACHGKGGEGDGPVADQLRFAPPDLTRIAERAGGAFPEDEVVSTVDGRDPVDGHGGPEMPIWGDAFRRADEGYDEKAAAMRIRRIVAHLKTLQKGADR